jgi:hypothetical protein
MHSTSRCGKHAIAAAGAAATSSGTNPSHSTRAMARFPALSSSMPRQRRCRQPAGPRTSTLRAQIIRFQKWLICVQPGEQPTRQ